MQSQQTIAAFFDWLSTKIDPAFVCRLREEWNMVPMGINMAVAARDPSEWPQLVDEYDERVGLIAEGRDATVEDMVAAWRSTLNIKEVNLATA